MSFLSQPVQIFPIQLQRKIDSIDVNVVMNEATTDKLTITKAPVQQGAMISDHAFKEPTEFTMSIFQRYNSTTSLSKMYQQFLDLQNARTPFTVVTPKRLYTNQLLSNISMVTDKSTENALQLNLSFQEIIIVNSTTTTVPRQKQKSPGNTGKTENAGHRSALNVGVDAIKQLSWFNKGGA